MIRDGPGSAVWVIQENFEYLSSHLNIIDFSRCWIKQNLKIEHIRRDEETVCVGIVGELQQTSSGNRFNPIDDLASTLDLNVVLQAIQCILQGLFLHSIDVVSAKFAKLMTEFTEINLLFTFSRASWAGPISLCPRSSALMVDLAVTPWAAQSSAACSCPSRIYF